MRGIGFIRFVGRFYPKQWHSFVAAVWKASKQHIVRKRKTLTENKYSNKLKRKRKAKSKSIKVKKTRGVQTATTYDHSMTLFNDVIDSCMTAMLDRWDTEVERVVKLSLIKMLCDLCSKQTLIDLERSNTTGPSRPTQFIFRAIRLNNASTGRAPQVLWRRQKELFECATCLQEGLCRCVSS